MIYHILCTSTGYSFKIIDLASLSRRKPLACVLLSWLRFAHSLSNAHQCSIKQRKQIHVHLPGLSMPLYRLSGCIRQFLVLYKFLPQTILKPTKREDCLSAMPQLRLCFLKRFSSKENPNIVGIYPMIHPSWHLNLSDPSCFSH